MGAGQGDISNEFVDYSHEVSLKHFLRFIEKWGLSNVSPDEIKALTKHLEAFECGEPEE